MSTTRRRGAPSMEPALASRREWYQSLQSHTWRPETLTLAGLEIPKTQTPMDGLADATSTAGMPEPPAFGATTTVHGAGGGASQASATTSAGSGLLLGMAAPTFMSSVLAISEELQAENNKKEVVEEVVIPPYVPSEHFSAEKWIVDLNGNATSSASLGAALFPTQINKNQSLPVVLLCFHDVGGNPYHFRSWSKELAPSGIKTYAVCLPERLNRSPAASDESLDSVYQAAGAVVDAIKALSIVITADTHDDGQYSSVVLFGHGLGALVAFEIARTLAEKNPEVEIKHLFVSSAASPAMQTEMNTDRYGTKYFCASDKELYARLDSYGGIPPLMKQRMDMLKTQFARLRKDYRLQEKYHYLAVREGVAENIACPITALGAIDDKSVSHKHVIDWCNFTAAPATDFIFKSGGHNMWMREPHVSIVLDFVRCACSGDDFIFPEEERAEIDDYY